MGCSNYAFIDYDENQQNDYLTPVIKESIDARKRAKRQELEDKEKEERELLEKEYLRQQHLLESIDTKGPKSYIDYLIKKEIPKMKFGTIAPEEEIVKDLNDRDCEEYQEGEVDESEEVNIEEIKKEEEKNKNEIDELKKQIEEMNKKEEEEKNNKKGKKQRKKGDAAGFFKSQENKEGEGEENNMEEKKEEEKEKISKKDENAEEKKSNIDENKNGEEGKKDSKKEGTVEEEEKNIGKLESIDGDNNSEIVNKKKNKKKKDKDETKGENEDMQDENEDKKNKKKKSKNKDKNDNDIENGDNKDENNNEIKEGENEDEIKEKKIKKKKSKKVDKMKILMELEVEKPPYFDQIKRYKYPKKEKPENNLVFSPNPSELIMCVIGDEKCGKTSFIKKYIDDEFDKEYKKTEKIETEEIETEIDSKKIMLKLIDTPSLTNKKNIKMIQEDGINKSHIIIYIFDINDEYAEFKVRLMPQSLEFNEKQIIVVIGNKSDKVSIYGSKNKEIIGDYCYFRKIIFEVISCGNTTKKEIEDFVKDTIIKEYISLNKE